MHEPSLRYPVMDPLQGSALDGASPPPVLSHIEECHLTRDKWMATQHVSRDLMEDGAVFRAPKHDLRARFHELGEFQWQDRYIACVIRDVVPNAETTNDYDWVVSFCYWQYKWAHASICDQKHVDTPAQRATFSVAKRVLIVDPIAAEKHRQFCNSHPESYL